ncbi:YfcC family protein [Cloacibacillus porcorum]|uniref:YfcC family protein n=1 Tax=Cloacibacillus porcorum TaxID=1197717 RepID=UPI003D064F54
MENARKPFKLPHVYIIFIIIMLIVVLLSWIVPSGEFGRVQDPVTKQMIVDPSDFHYIEKSGHITPLAFFQSIHDGIVQSGDIVISLLLIAGVIALIESTGAIAAGIHKILEISAGKELTVIVVLMTIFTVMGAIGFGEGGMPFFPLAISVVMALGYDRMAGAATAILGMCVGFSSGLINLFTTGIAQIIVGLPLFSGIEFRLCALAVFYLITLAYLLHYCHKIRKDPAKSVLRDEYMTQDCKAAAGEHVQLGARHRLALLGLFLLFVFQGLGALKWGWHLPQIAAIYLMYAALLIIIFRISPSGAMGEIIFGAQRMLPAALAIGLARAVMILMNQAKIIDTVVNAAGSSLAGKSPVTTLLLIYFAVTGFNFFIVSGSGKAVMMMPILSPLGKLLGINQQVMVLSFQYGDGFTNYLWPCGALVALSVCGIEYADWLRFSWKIFAALITAGFILILTANYIGLGPF